MPSDAVKLRIRFRLRKRRTVSHDRITFRLSHIPGRGRCAFNERGRGGRQHQRPRHRFGGRADSGRGHQARSHGNRGDLGRGPTFHLDWGHSHPCKGPDSAFATLHQGALYLSMPEPSAVTVTAFGAQGRELASIERQVAQGSHLLALPQAGPSAAFYRVQSGTYETVLGALPGDGALLRARSPAPGAHPDGPRSRRPAPRRCMMLLP